MKVILSRKGLDSTYCDIANLCINNTELVMLPIMSKNNTATYKDLSLCENPTTSNVVEQIFNHSKTINTDTHCHVDPNLINFYKVDSFLGSLGQVNSSQAHLLNQGVSVGDIFIFFGLFNDCNTSQSEVKVFKSKSKHIIFGYLQIGEIVYPNSLSNKERHDYESKYSWLKLHPHWNKEIEDFSNDKNNCIYIARETCTFDNSIKGYGTFNFDKDLVLTKSSESTPTHWELSKELQGLKISYHNDNSQKKDYFQSALRGQEFVIEECPQAEQWAINLIKKYSKNRGVK